MSEPLKTFHRFLDCPKEVQMMIFEFAGSRASNKPASEQQLPNANDNALRLVVGQLPSFDSLVRTMYNDADTRFALFHTNRLARQVMLEQWKKEIEELKFVGVHPDAPNYFYEMRLQLWKTILLGRVEELLDSVRGKYHEEESF